MACDFCKADCDAHYYDARTRFGPWATMCPACWPKNRYSPKLATGYGQEFKLVDGKRRKVTG